MARGVWKNTTGGSFFSEKYTPFFEKWTHNKAQCKNAQMSGYFFILIFQSVGSIMERVYSARWRRSSVTFGEL